MQRWAFLIYGVVAYVLFLGTFLYLIAFVEGWAVPRTVDGGGPISAPGVALLIDLALLALFGLQHSIMARPAFKRALTRAFPAVIERSNYVLDTGLVLVFLFWQWRPLPETVWSVASPLLAKLVLGLSLAGWGLVLVSTFLIDHFELFGLRQVFAQFRGVAAKPTPFVERLAYRVVRHPIMLGFLIAFWAAPTMSQGRLLFALGLTVYVLIALRLEERDLVAEHGEAYRSYQRRVSMVLPFPRLGAKG